MYQQTKVIGSADELLRHHLIREETQWSHNAVNVLTEEKKNKLTDNIVTKLFKDIKAKSMNVDFAEIDSSRGNITHFKNYNALNNAINYLDKIANSNANKNVSDLKDVVSELKFAMATLKKYSREFEFGFKLNNAVIKYLYDSVVISLIQGTSFVVAESVDYVKDNLNLYKTELKPSAHIMKNIHIKSIISFNQMERKSQLSKLFRDTQQFKESAGQLLDKATKFLDTFQAGKIIAALGLIGFALTFIRASIFAYYNSRVKLSQYLNHLKEFVLMNASTIDGDARKVKEKQEKVAKMLEKLSDIISVDQNVSNDRANSQLEDSNKVIALDNKTPKDDTTVDLGLF